MNRIDDPPEINPYAVPRTAPVRPPVAGPSTGVLRRRFAFTLAVLILLGSPLASAVALFDIESIVASGAILSVCALSLLFAARHPPFRPLWWISFAMLAMSIGCFLTIFLKEWSPGQAQTPVGWATVVFAFLIQYGWILVGNVRRDIQATLPEDTLPDGWRGEATELPEQ